MTDILTAVSSVTTLIGDVFTAITSNPLLTFFVAAGILGVGIGMFRRLRSSAR